jgi:hypothetical protein
MTIINRIMVGTIVDGTSVFAVFDPFFDAIQIEINGRSFTSWEKSVQRKQLHEATKFADNLRHLLVECYGFTADKGYTMFKRCVDDMQKYTA